MAKEENYLAMVAPSIAEPVLHSFGVNKNLVCECCGIKCHGWNGIDRGELSLSERSVLRKQKKLHVETAPSRCQMACA